MTWSTGTPRRALHLSIVRIAVASLIPMAFAALPASASAVPGAISTVAGNGNGGFGGDGGPATSAQLNGPSQVAATPGGGYLIADRNNNRIRSVSPSGVISTVAGTGGTGFSGDGGPATAAQLFAADVAPTAGGGFLIADATNSRIRNVSPAGIITTVAGNGTAGFSGDGGPATAAALLLPTGVAATADGGFLIADESNARIRKVSAGGVITTVAGTGTNGSSGDGGAATAAQIQFPTDVAPTADGGFLIADSGNNKVRKVFAGGTITTVAGTGSAGFSGDGGSATSAQLSTPAAVAASADGGFLIADRLNSRIRSVDAAGAISTVAGSTFGGFGGDGGAAVAAMISSPAGVSLTTDGGFLIGDAGNARIRKVEAGKFPGGGGSLDTKITKGPKKKTHKRKVKLSFTAVPAGSAASFLCKLDKKPFKACKSPKKYRRLKRGKHVFKVQAVDAAGNADPTPAVRKFKVVKRKRRHA